MYDTNEKMTVLRTIMCQETIPWPEWARVCSMLLDWDPEGLEVPLLYVKEHLEQRNWDLPVPFPWSKLQRGSWENFDRDYGPGMTLCSQYLGGYTSGRSLFLPLHWLMMRQPEGWQNVHWADLIPKMFRHLESRCLTQLLMGRHLYYPPTGPLNTVLNHLLKLACSHGLDENAISCWIDGTYEPKRPSSILEIRNGWLSIRRISRGALGRAPGGRRPLLERTTGDLAPDFCRRAGKTEIILPPREKPTHTSIEIEGHQPNQLEIPPTVKIGDGYIIERDGFHWFQRRRGGARKTNVSWFVRAACVEVPGELQRRLIGPKVDHFRPRQIPETIWHVADRVNSL